mmetsp:Transcript_16009/g.37957  ORF Transcript_16009/g.37957 Transcript_16009/m.37957 type:complete len:233 (-) Transcript_16009:291-989(-)
MRWLRGRRPAVSLAVLVAPPPPPRRASKGRRGRPAGSPFPGRRPGAPPGPRGRGRAAGPPRRLGQELRRSGRLIATARPPLAAPPSSGGPVRAGPEQALHGAQPRRRRWAVERSMELLVPHQLAEGTGLLRRPGLLPRGLSPEPGPCASGLLLVAAEGTRALRPRSALREGLCKHGRHLLEPGEVLRGLVVHLEPHRLLDQISHFMCGLTKQLPKVHVVAHCSLLSILPKSW